MYAKTNAKHAKTDIAETIYLPTNPLDCTLLSMFYKIVSIAISLRPLRLNLFIN
jgi:hypothetical protein